MAGCVERFFDGGRQNEEELHSRADAAYGAASRERNTGSGSMPQDGDRRTNLLQVEASAGGHDDRRADTIATVGRRNKKLKTLEADLTLDKHMAVRGAQKNF